MNMIDKVLALASAGYTKDEISQLLAVQEPAPVPDSEPQPEPEPAPAQQAPQQAAPAGMDALNARLDKLIARMEQDSINRSNQPPKETTDDILASIIRPKRKE